MKFLAIQVIIVILVCIFFSALSNLTELGAIGWVIAGSTGHGLYKVYKHMHYSYRKTESKEKCASCNRSLSGLSEQIQSFMFDDASGVRDE